MEMRALTETQKQERKSATHFENNKSTLQRARNPIFGETMGAAIVLTNENNNSDSVDLLIAESSLKRSDMLVERIGCLQHRQDSITGELEYLKMKIKAKEAAVKIAKENPIRF
jgi:hypothetical protein